MKKLHVKLTFTEPVLGTWPSNQNIAREFIASKSPDAASIEDEVAALGADAVADKGMTVFPEMPRVGRCCMTTRSKVSLKTAAACLLVSEEKPRPGKSGP